MGLDPCDLTHSMNLSTYAVTYNSLDNVLYLSMSMMSATVEYLFTSRGSSTGSDDNTSTSAAVSWTFSMSVGFHVGLNFSDTIHSGPCIHNTDVCRNESGMPLVNKSAGLSADGQ